MARAVVLFGRRLFACGYNRLTVGKSAHASYSSASAYTSATATSPGPSTNSDDAPAAFANQRSFREIPQAWLTSLGTVKEQRMSLVDLNPDIFRVTPRPDLLYRNISWQKNYRDVTFIKALSRAEMPGTNKKPWPQKGLGRSRHGSKRSPLFFHGGICNGSRGPKTKFYMLPNTIRLEGLRIALTIKHAQDDLVIVDDFESLSTAEPEFLQDLAAERNWGYSVLFVDNTDIAPTNLSLATAEIAGFEIMPVYGLNCYSMLYFDTLVLSKSALDKIDERLTYHMNKIGAINKPFKYMDYKRLLLNEGEHEEDEYHAPFFGLKMSLVYFNKMIQILESSPELKNSVIGIARQCGYAVAGVAAGGVVAGPPGALMGGIVGSVLGYCRSQEYKPLLTVLQQLSIQQKEELVLRIQELIGSRLIEDLSIFVQSEVQRQLLLSTVQGFVDNK